MGAAHQGQPIDGLHPSYKKNAKYFQTRKCSLKKMEIKMYPGICLSVIDHRGCSRKEARETALNLKKQFGLTSVELVLEGVGRLYAPYPWEWGEEEIADVSRFADPFEHKGAHLPFYNLNVIAVNERVREDAMAQMQSAIEVAGRLNLDYVVAHATGTTEGMMTDREHQRNFKAFKRMAGWCREAGIALTIENAANLHEIDECIDMIHQLRDEGCSVGMTFDTGHANISRLGKEPPYMKYGTVADALMACKDVLQNVHLHNNDGTADQHRGLRNGTIDLETCISRLAEAGYKGSLSMETRTDEQRLADDCAVLMEWCQ